MLGKKIKNAVCQLSPQDYRSPVMLMHEGSILNFRSKINSTCELGVQKIALTPGASSTCGGGNCSCSSCCSW